MSEAKDPEEGMQRVIKFLQENGIGLRLSDGEDNYIDHHRVEIVVSKNQTKEHQLYTVLHELGHYFLEPGFDVNSPVATIIEEVLAWDRGKDIAEALGIAIGENSWNTLMEESIAQYLEEY